METHNVEGMTTQEALNVIYPPVLGFDLKSETQYNGAVDTLKSLAYHYHKGVKDPNAISDANYNDLLAQLAQYEQDHPKEKRPDSPVGKVKGGVFDEGFSLERPVAVAEAVSSGSAGTSPVG